MTKYTLNLQATADDPECFRALLIKATQMIDDETEQGLIVKRDGDQISWRTIIEQEDKK